jgi:hypothetical protein
VGKDLVAVEEEDGFETTLLMRECVLIESLSPKKETISATTTKTIEVKRNDTPVTKIVETATGNRLNIVLAFMPTDDQILINTKYEAYLVNNSNYFVQFNYLSKQGRNWILRKTGTVEPNQQLFIEEFSKDQLNDLEQIGVQFITYKKEKQFELKQPVSVEFKVDTVKFYKQHCFVENEYFEDNAMIFTIVKDDVSDQSFAINPKDLANAMKMKGDFKSPTNQASKAVNELDLLEVDLHINELLDNSKGMSNTELITVQLDKFTQVMNANLRLKGKKIVFIHGKGEGVLRKAILDELKSKYKACLFQDASFREYGFGATMVIIK